MGATPQDNAGLPREAIDVFARGLFHIASVDGIEPREEKLIRDFLEETSCKLAFEQLGDAGFSPIEAAQVLDTSYLRRVFVRAAIALVRADGKYSDGERHVLGEIADAFGLTNTEFGDLEQEAARQRID
ncbi:MAG TPA: TerB family tellurite resistance protein [Nannocystaceae bacterium]|nr:TerB family tellurite resistance protein [Nannocystaceae bacterium]